MIIHTFIEQLYIYTVSSMYWSPPTPNTTFQRPNGVVGFATDIAKRWYIFAYWSSCGTVLFPCFCKSCSVYPHTIYIAQTLVCSWTSRLSAIDLFKLLGLKFVCYDGVIIRYSIEKSWNNCFAFTNFFSIPLFVSLKLEAAFGSMETELSRHAEANKVMYLRFANY